jgi:hypothetical protein
MSGCKCAKPTDEYHGWYCAVSGGECMFLIPNSKRCAEIYGEEPDAVEEEEFDDNIKLQEAEKAAQK